MESQLEKYSMKQVKTDTESNKKQLDAFILETCKRFLNQHQLISIANTNMDKTKLTLENIDMLDKKMNKRLEDMDNHIHFMDEEHLLSRQMIEKIRKGCEEADLERKCPGGQIDSAGPKGIAEDHIQWLHSLEDRVQDTWQRVTETENWLKHAKPKDRRLPRNPEWKNAAPTKIKGPFFRLANKDETKVFISNIPET